MQKKIIWLTLSCLMVLSLVIASCGPAVTEEEVTEEEEVVTGEEIVTEEEEVPAEEERRVSEEMLERYRAEGAEMVVNTAGRLVEKPRYGGTEYISRTTDITRFDDSVAGIAGSASTATLMLTSNELYTGDWAKGSQGTSEATWTLGATWFVHLEMPCLATSYELPDDETVIYHIRQGVHFHNKPPVNGREMNAHDVAYSLQRMYSSSGSYLNLTYPKEWVNGPQFVRAIDDWTVEISNIPAGWLYTVLASSSDFVPIHPPEMIEEFGSLEEWQNSCGTGPFMLTDYVPVSSLTLERNPNYWMHNPLHPEDQLPYLDGIVFLIIPDAQTAQAGFRVGKIDTRPSIVKYDWEALITTNPELIWASWPPTGNAAIVMNQANPELPYDDIRVRKALFYGINHQEILDDYYEGFGKMLSSPVCALPEFKDMYIPLEEMSEEIQKLYGYYPEEARQLLAEAGYPNGFSCTVLTGAEGMLPIIKEYWADIGVTMDIDLRQSQVISGILSGTKICEDMYYSATGGTSMFKCHGYPKDTPNNNAGIVDERFEEFYTQVNMHMLDWDKVAQLHREINPYLLEQAYYIHLPNDYVYYLWWPWVKGWAGEITVGYYNTYNFPTYLWIDTELKEEMVGRAD